MTESNTLNRHSVDTAELPAWWSFASPVMLDAAASMFPTSEVKNTAGGWSVALRSELPDVYTGETPDQRKLKAAPATIERGVERREGGFPALTAGAGFIKYSVTDTNRAERAAEKLRNEFSVQKYERYSMATRYKQRHSQDSVQDPEQLFELPEGLESSARGKVSSWSRKSQNELRRKIGSLDLGEFLGAGIPVFLTLTLPRPWEQITPTAEHAFSLFRRWQQKFVKQYGPLRCIWKREFQRRGAPHWHLWLVLPAGVGESEFRTWVSLSWASSLRVGSASSDAERPFLSDVMPNHFELSKKVGTTADFLSAAASGTVQRLTNYFLKESVASGNKNYQNMPPALWAGQSVGRFWGVKGINVATVEVTLDPRISVPVWRAMRKWREAQRRTVVRQVQRISMTSGVVRSRRVRRRVTQRTPAGYIMVPDGAAFLADLGRYVTQLTETMHQKIREEEEKQKLGLV